MSTTDESGLSEKQREVLTLVRDGKNPTDVGRAMGITSQAVHGHLRRLRSRGLLPEGPAKSGRASAPSNGFDPANALAAIHAAARQQVTEIEARMTAIDAQREALTAEKKTLASALTEVKKHLPPEA